MEVLSAVQNKSQKCRRSRSRWLCGCKGGSTCVREKNNNKKNKKTKDNSPLRCPDLPGSYGPDVQGRGLAYAGQMSSSLMALNHSMASKPVAKFASKHVSTFAVPWHRHTERPAQGWPCRKLLGVHFE